MMKRGLIVLVAVGALSVAGGAMLVGCGDATSERPPAAQLKEGVNLLDVRDPTVGMNAAFMKAGRVVYVQTRIGGLKPDVYRQTAPNDPPNETDLRFVDQHGNTFYVQRGGDNYVDPTWASDIAAHTAANKKIAATEREIDWGLAQEASTALGAALPASFKDHTFHLANYARRPLPSADPILTAKAQRIALTPPTTAEGTSTGYQNFNFSGWSWLETDLYSHDICFAWVCPAKHSATAMYDCEWNGSSCNWVFAVNSCNHGACATSGQDTYQCYSNGGWFANATITGDTSQSVGTVSGGCLTGYNWNTPPGHECNDDAAYQLSQAKSGSANTAWGGQWNFNRTDLGHNYACDCNINGCSGDWKQPVCP